MKSVIVLPTYNEAENLPKMIDEIFNAVPSVSILVVDDQSPDGTGQLAEKLAEAYPQQLSVLHRQKKEGLGKAYLDGFRHALQKPFDCIVQMDADFSHPASLLPRMMEALEKYDFVLGSRYIPGGGIENWSWHRRLLSWGGNLYARLILRSPIRDLTGGFKGFRRPVLEHLLRCPLDSSGYSFQIETTCYALAKGFRYLEIPFLFAERQSGVSKMSRKIVAEALIKTFRLRKKLHDQPFPFCTK